MYLLRLLYPKEALSKIKFLISKGADVNIVSDSGLSVKCYAIKAAEFHKCNVVIDYLNSI